MKTPDIRKIDFELPIYWNDDQALAVFELIDDLRKKILAHYGTRIYRLIGEDHQPDNSPIEINEEDLPFRTAAYQRGGRRSRLLMWPGLMTALGSLAAIPCCRIMAITRSDYAVLVRIDSGRGNGGGFYSVKLAFRRAENGAVLLVGEALRVPLYPARRPGPGLGVHLKTRRRAHARFLCAST